MRGKRVPHPPPLSSHFAMALHNDDSAATDTEAKANSVHSHKEQVANEARGKLDRHDAGPEKNAEEQSGIKNFGQGVVDSLTAVEGKLISTARLPKKFGEKKFGQVGALVKGKPCQLKVVEVGGCTPQPVDTKDVKNLTGVKLGAHVVCPTPRSQTARHTRQGSRSLRQRDPEHTAST